MKRVQALHKMEFGNKSMELAKKYDRSLILIITAVGTILTIYISISKSFNDLVTNTTIVKELQQVNAVQREINDVVKSNIMEMKDDIKTILRNMPRR